jgi:hypothetical protein
VLLVDGVNTLINVVIVDFIQIDLISQVLFHEVETTIVAQSKDGLYCNRFSTDMFILVIVKVFTCLHK